MRARSMWGLVVLFALLPGSAGPRTQAGVAIPAAVLAAAQAGNLVDVIVGVDAAFVPEGRLPSVAAVTAQRAAVTQTLDAAVTRATDAGALVRQRFDQIPYFRAEASYAALQALAALPGITSIQENGVNHAILTRSVPFVNAPPAWAAGATGAGWSVAVLDTGVDATHPFLSGRLSSEACYSGGGPSTTSVCPGGAPSTTAAGSAVPCGLPGCHHGTAVAGVALGANGPGGSNGTAPGANLIAIQIFSRADSVTDCGGQAPCSVAWDADLISALTRVSTLAGPGNANHVAAVNLSVASFARFPTQGACDAGRSAVRAAIDNVRSLEIAVVAGAGNDGVVNELPSPACITGATSVGATTDAVPVVVAEFSNDAPFLNLLAPGVQITTAVPGGTFGAVAGTSFSTPHVAGAWAVLKQAVPGASVAAVQSALAATGTPIAHSITGNVHPIINVNAARLQLLGASGSAPGAVTALRVSATGNALAMSWAAPQAGGTPVAYTVLARLAPGGPVVATVPAGNATGFSAAAPSGTFVVSVQASNGAGVGPESNPVSVTLPGLPALPFRPTNLAVTVAGSTATFTWTAPTGGGPRTNYLMAAGPTPFSYPAPAQLPLPASATATVIPAVPAGTWYARLYSQNASGYSASSNEVSLTVAGPAAPGTPTLNPAVVNGPTVNLSWTPGAGGTPTSYVLAAAMTPGGPAVATVPVTGTAAAIPNVPPGTYYVRIAATNALGTSAASNQITVVVS